MAAIDTAKGAIYILPVQQSLRFTLPSHEAKKYAPVRKCIYCRSEESLTKEHIIPYAAGGRWVLPDASCSVCATTTATFEGEFSRTILGPLRMLYNLPTRRPKDRPRHLPLKVKYSSSTDWEIAYVDRGICPFLVLLPLYPMPDILTGAVTDGNRSAATSTMWIRGTGFWQDKDAQLQWLCNALGASSVMPTATLRTEPFCLTLAKIAHSFTVAELGLGAFNPFLSEIILTGDLSNRAQFIGGGRGDEVPSERLHELSFDNSATTDPNIIAVRIRLFGLLGTPTYHVAVGRKT